MERKEAFELIKNKIQNQNLIKHSLSVEACMKGLAIYFKEAVEKWAIAGLLHDIDYEETKDDPNLHSIKGAEILEKLGLEKEISEAVKTHNEAHGIMPESKLAKALFCVDPLTGLIVAATLVLPTKKISDLTIENILNRFKEKSFARGAKRDVILKCSEIGLSLEEFIKIGLESMKSINIQLGL
jgi:hypothetical protein